MAETYSGATVANENPHLAVLIDADNVAERWAPAIFGELATLGEATVRRIYGDFSTPSLNGWRQVLQEHAIIPHHQPAYTSRKNSSDIALVIDAMDILHSGRVQGFVLVSSDSDFTRLASRIREQGLNVIGIGEERTPKSLRKACNRFILLENLHTAPQEAEASETRGASRTPIQNGPTPTRHTQPPSKVVPLVLDIMSKEEEDWIQLSALGSHLRAANPDFDSRTYGHAKLSDLLEKAGAFEVDRDPPIRVRRKQPR